MITNSFLNEVASAITSNTFVTPGYLGVATTVVSSIGATATSLSGEIGDRVILTKTVSGRQASYAGVRTVASVVTVSTGDNIQSVGLLTGSTSGNLHQGIVIGGLTQTTNFNLEVDVNVIVDR